ncbi:wax ester/triacylglycerol synthase domain-containing protein [Spirillospora sp. NPDC050679]
MTLSLRADGETTPCPDSMNTLDTLMWRCQDDPMLRAPLVILMLLDRVPDWGRVKADHAWAARAVPRLRHRPTGLSLIGGRCGWEEDPEFDVGRHLRRLRLPEPGGRAELLELARHIAAGPFDDRRPLWDSTLVEGLTWDGGQEAGAWILRIHHCVADGRAIGYWLTRLLRRSHLPAAPRDEPEPPPARRHRHLSVLTEATVNPASAQPAMEDLLSGRTLRRSALGLARTARKPLDITVETARTLRAAGELAPLPVCEPSPLLRARGTERHLGMMSLPLDGLRAAARTVGCAPSDAYLAALLGGMRIYHAEHGASAGDLPVAVPLSLPRPAGMSGGNRIGGIRFAAPLNQPDPRKRMTAVRDRAARARDAFAPAGLDLMLTLLNRLPGPQVAHLVGRLGRSSDLQASQVPGMYHPGHLADATVLDAHCFGPAPGCAVMTVLLAHRNRGSLGVTLDAAAVTDPAGFMRALDEGFREVLATASP